MPHGGRRPGAGRKPGIPSQKTLARLKIAEQATAEGITPLEVMLQTMRALWDQGTVDARLQACHIAKEVAPYLHPRLTAIDMTTDQIVEHVIRVPAKSQSAETWLSDYMQPTKDTVQ